MADSSETKIWRYMDLGKFISMLSSEALFFACPSEFEDPFEGMYPKSHVQAFSSITQQYLDQMRATRDALVVRCPGININGLDLARHTAMERFQKGFDDVRLKFGVSCWHKNETESEAMWKLYSASGYGIAIEATEKQLREAIIDKSTLVVDAVRYMDFDNDQIEKGHKNYGMFLKRKSFEHERELRATVLLANEGKGNLVKCDLDALITNVHISPFAPAYLKEVVDNVCSRSVRGLHKPVVPSSLFDKPSGDYRLKLKL